MSDLSKRLRETHKPWTPFTSEPNKQVCILDGHYLPCSSLLAAAEIEELEAALRELKHNFENAMRLHGHVA